MSFLFSSPSVPDIPPLPPPPTKAATDPAAKAMADMLKKRKGFLSTIVTGPEGLTTTAPTQKAELLAGGGSYG